MGLDIGGNTIVKSGAGIALNSLVFNSAGQGSANPIPGYSGWKNGGNYYAAVAGWETSNAQWQSGLNTTTGVFTCPVAGLYALGYNGIHNGGSGLPAGKNTYGYSCFAKNGVMSYHTHWNQGNAPPNTVWNTSGTSAVFSCAAGDTLALFVNRSPSPTSPDAVAQNYGLYPTNHHCIWCKLIG
jgi:hypothetical protein